MADAENAATECTIGWGRNGGRKRPCWRARCSKFSSAAPAPTAYRDLALPSRCRVLSNAQQHSRWLQRSIWFDRVRASPCAAPNVGMIVGPEGRNANYIIISIGYGGTPSPPARPRIIITELGLNAEPVLIEMMAVIAAQERRMISRRTKAALAATKARGVKLGGYRHDGPNTKLPALERAAAPRPVFAELAALSSSGRGQGAQRTRHQDRDRQGLDRRPGYRRARTSRRPSVGGNGLTENLEDHEHARAAAFLLLARMAMAHRLNLTCR